MHTVMQTSRPRRLIVLTTLTLALAACGQQAPTQPTPSNTNVNSETLNITPAQAQLKSGATQEFTVNTRNVTWQTSGGTLTGQGATVTWTAPTTPGTYTLTATDAVGKRAVTARVTVAATQPTPVFEKKLDTVTQLRKVETDAAGNVYVAGESREAQQYPICTERFPAECSYDAYVAKYTPDGTLVWKKTFGALATPDANQSELAYDLVVEPNGTSYALYRDPLGVNSTLVKLTPEGNEAWSKTVTATALDLNASGQLSVWRRTDTFATTFATLTEYGADGTPGRKGTFAVTPRTVLKLAPNNSVFSAEYDHATQDVRLTRYTFDGARVWARHYKDERPGASSTVHDLAFDARSNVYVSWSSEVNSSDVQATRASLKAFLKKYSVDGAWQFNTEVPVQRDATLSDSAVVAYSSVLEVSAQGNAYLNASTFFCALGERCSLDRGGYIRWNLSRLTSSGTLVWTVAGDDSLNDLAVSGERLFRVEDAGDAHLGGLLARLDH